MGLRGWLSRRAVRATRVLVVECPDGWAVRVATERVAAQRGWRLALSPASADVLLVAGHPAGELAEAVERCWEAMPGPRARTAVDDPGDLPRALDEVTATLLDHAAQAVDAADRPAPGDGMDHGDHEGMDHGDMDMAPDGIPLAEGSADDRDGLEMDALPMRLGPVLPYWPAGLVLDVTLHGDLVVTADGRLVGSDRGVPLPGDDRPDLRAARHCDEAAAVLALAGWTAGTSVARSARDALLAHGGDDSRAALADLRHRVESSRVLRRSLGGVGIVTEDRARRLGLPGFAVGDCRDRLLSLLDRATAAAREYALGQSVDDAAVTEGEPRAPVAVPVDALGDLAAGHDLAVARLLVATLGTPVATAEVSADA